MMGVIAAKRFKDRDFEVSPTISRFDALGINQRRTVDRSNRIDG